MRSVRTCIYIDGYWIKYYEPPPESLAAKKALIEALTRRLFNHVEHGINIPGIRWPRRGPPTSARPTPTASASTAPCSPARCSTAPPPSSPSWWSSGRRRRGRARRRADEGVRRLPAGGPGTGPLVRHRGGDEGIDELWGEPFKAFSQPIADLLPEPLHQDRADHARHRPHHRHPGATFEGSTQVPASKPLLASSPSGQAQVRDPAHRPGHLRGLAGLRRRPRPTAQRAAAAAAGAVAGGDPRGPGGQPHPQGRHGAWSPTSCAPGADAEERARADRPVRPIPPHLSAAGCPARRGS
jgi:hypothetical protein